MGDLFHTISQTIDTVLTCDWYDSFKNYKMSDSNSDDKTMDTAPGGETPQYESIKTETLPSSKQRGQLGSGSNTSEEASTSADRGQQTAENIRFWYGRQDDHFVWIRRPRRWIWRCSRSDRT